MKRKKTNDAKPHAADLRNLSPAGVWAGYDPRAEALDEEVLRRWTRGGVAYKEVRFTAETHQGQPVRVLAVYAAPTGGRKLPGMLHVHGGGQTVDPAWLAFWTRRGYAALTFDWGGQREGREKYTQWGALAQGNHVTFNGFSTLPRPQDNSWYHWTLVCRRALTYLERQSEVDPRRLGAFGISMGGTLMWNLAVDERLKAGCAIYGAGWNTVRDVPRYGPDSGKHAPPEHEARWLATLAPQSCAPLVRFPMLFLSATNDVHGNMDRAWDTLNAIPPGVPRCAAFTPRFNHHVFTPQARSLPLWMDTFLKGRPRWPRQPQAGFTLAADKSPLFQVLPDRPADVRRVEMLYAVANLWPFNRHWRDVRAVRRGKVWQAATPVLDAGEYLFAFANIYYRNGACISTPLAAVVPSQIGAAATDSPSRQIHDGRLGFDGFMEYCRSTEPRPPFKSYAILSRGPQGRRGIGIRPGACTITYKIGDPKWHAPAGAVLAFDVATPADEELSMILRISKGPGGTEDYAAIAKAEGSRAWRTVRLASNDFKHRKTNETLAALAAADMLEVRRPGGDASTGKMLIVTNFRWE
ncbi:MAG: acetylxylan esterase [Planctomycetaceae bacterium]|nr:acetylxylan esterase [Planctomycetaceae bacterium]